MKVDRVSESKQKVTSKRSNKNDPKNFVTVLNKYVSPKVKHLIPPWCLIKLNFKPLEI